MYPSPEHYDLERLGKENGDIIMTELICNECNHEWMSADEWEFCPECESDSVDPVGKINV